MIRYAGTPQLGDYVIVNDKPEDIRVVTTIVMNVDTAIKYSLDDMIIGFEQEDLTRVKPDWNVGELVRYKGKVYKVQNVTVRNYKFVYTLDDKDWVAEKDLEHVNDIRHSFRSDDWINVNKYCIYEQFRGMKGKINVISHLGANCFLRGIGPQSYDIPWEAIDVVEEKVKPYNAELICIKSNDCAWEVGDLAIVKDNEMYFIENIGKKLIVAENVGCLDAVNKFFPRVTFAEIKETIGDKEGWSGKFYVVDTTADSPLKVGNVYIVKKGVLNIDGRLYLQIFTSFKEIQKQFPYMTLIKVKEVK